MAFTTDHHKLVVRGTFDNGEVWTNTWGYDTTPGGSVADACAAFHDFYVALFAHATGISDNTKSVGAVSTNLSTNVSEECTWATVTGAFAGSLLPTSCAIRASLSNDAGHRGGPFISGWSEAAIDADGNLTGTLQTAMADDLEDLLNALVAVNVDLSIISTKDSTLYPVTMIRVGQRYDVIRKRTNDLAEAYEVRP